MWMNVDEFVDEWINVIEPGWMTSDSKRDYDNNGRIKFQYETFSEWMSESISYSAGKLLAGPPDMLLC